MDERHKLYIDFFENGKLGLFTECGKVIPNTSNLTITNGNPSDGCIPEIQVSILLDNANILMGLPEEIKNLRSKLKIQTMENEGI